MSGDLIAIDHRECANGGHIALVGLCHPPLNLVSAELLGELSTVLHRLEREAEGIGQLRAVVLHQGASRAFCAGSDVSEFRHVAESPAARKVLLENHALRRLAQLAVPVIAAIDGAALGGGLELALACDLRVCGRSARLGLPEARIGGLASNGSQRLTKLVGPGRAKMMLFSGRSIDAGEALLWGLANEVVDDGTALQSALVLAETIAANGPISVRLSKRLADVAVDAAVDAGVTAGIAAQESVFASDDLREGTLAFREKRTARFRGR